MRTTMLCALLVMVAVFHAHTAQALCVTDESCFFNGRCVAGACVCHQGWRNENCSALNLLPAPLIGAYGYAPNVTSWGGNVVRDKEGLYHLYVSEMINHCGLCRWQTNSEVAHAVSKDLLGPYTFSNVAISDWSHNPQIVVDRSGKDPLYLIFHIGAGIPNGPVKCPPSEKLQATTPTDIVYAIHASRSLDGPWQPVNATGFPNCNNPTAHVFSNGSIFVVCLWDRFRGYFAQSYKGPYVERDFQLSGDAGLGNWEDPFIWHEHGVWKLLSHVWIGTGDLYAKRVGGFAYSKDGSNWIQTWQEPYDNKVILENKSVLTLTTRERPKLLFDENGKMLALFNGVASVVGGQKDICGTDWTYTMAQAIA